MSRSGARSHQARRLADPRRLRHRLARGRTDETVVDVLSVPPSESSSAIAALKALADQETLPHSKVSEAITKFGIDPEKADPTTV